MIVQIVHLIVLSPKEAPTWYEIFWSYGVETIDY